MADVDTWLADVSGTLDITLDDVLPEAMRTELLELTGEIAHTVERLAVPLTSYLIGIAVGQGATPQEAMQAVGRLLPDAGTGSSH
jgi:hypothetical protein